MNRITELRRALLAGALSASLMTAASGAEISNIGAEDLTIVVTEKGVRTELVVKAAETLMFCNTGCFVLFSTGTILPLKGPEKVEVKDGEPQVIAR